MSMNVLVGEALPNEFMPTMPVSSSNFVVSRRYREYTTDAQTTFTFNGTDTIRFIINSPDSFLDGRNSWIQFKLFGGFTADGGLNNIDAEKLSRYLETGGGHSLFRRLRISLSNGTIISDYDYSTLYAIIRTYTMSQNHLQFSEASQSFDGLASDIYEYGTNSSKVLMTQPFTLAQTAAATLGALGGGVQVLTIANAGVNLRVGDEIIISSNVQIAADVPSTIYAKVVSIAAAGGTCSIAPREDYGARVAGNIREIQVLRRGDLTPRFRGAQGTADTDANSVLIKIKLLSDFLNNVKYIPLPFLRNLQIELTLNRDAHCVVFSKPATGTPDFRWSITNPVFVANLITPSEKLMNLFVEEYNSENGIVMKWIDYQSNKRTLTNRAQNESMVIPCNCHSALGILAVQRLPESEAVNADTWVNDTNGTFVKHLVDTYQFQIGSEYYPFGAPVKCHGVHNGNAFTHLIASLDNHGAKYESTSVVPNEFYSVNTITRPVGGAINDESLKFVMGQNFSRDLTLTGVDCTSNDIQLNLVRSAAPGAPRDGAFIHTFVIHDRLIRISKASTIVYS